jgi:hypothetical protein
MAILLVIIRGVITIFNNSALVDRGEKQWKAVEINVFIVQTIVTMCK